jgi:plastocyanin
MVRVRSSARGSAACLALALALAAAACSKSVTPSGSIPTSPPTTPAPVESSASPSPSGGTAAVTVSQINYEFSPSNLTVSQGDTIAVKDATTGTPHTFTVEGKGIDVVNDAGQTQTVTIDLPPGTYPFICRFHSSLGMKGTLTVK